VSDTPDPAQAAAQELAARGEHVHLVSGGESRCLTGHCTPASPAA
jgi:hypothetical protein